MSKNINKGKDIEENAIGHEANLSSTREGNIDGFPEAKSVKDEALNYKREDNVKDVEEENIGKTSPKEEKTNDQKGGNSLFKGSLSSPAKITLALASAVTAVVAVVAVVPKTTSPTISGVCSFLEGAISCHLSLKNPSSIPLYFLVNGKTNGFSYSETLDFPSASSSFSSGPKGLSVSSSSDSSSVSSVTQIITFDRDVIVPDYSNYDVYIKGNIGYGETTYFHVGVSEESDGVVITGEPFWNDDRILQSDLKIVNPNDYDLTLSILDAKTSVALMDPIALPKQGAYSEFFEIDPSKDVSFFVKASKGYSSRDVYFRSVASMEKMLVNPYDLKALFLDKYLVYGYYLQDGKKPLGQSTLTVPGDDDDYSFSKELTETSDYADTLSLDANKHYTVSLYGYSGNGYKLMATSGSMSSSPLVVSPKVVGMNRTLFLSSDTSIVSYGDLAIDVYNESRTSLLGSYPFRDNTYCVLPSDGPYAYDISAEFPNGEDSAEISRAVYSSMVTTDQVQEPTIIAASIATENTLYYSLSNSYSGTGDVLSATYSMNIYSSAVKDNLLSVIDLGGDPSLWAPGLKALSSYPSYYYEIVAKTSYGDKTYFSKTVDNEHGVIPHIYGDIYARRTDLVLDLTSSVASLGSSISISKNDGTSLYSGKIADNAYSASFTSETSENNYSVQVASDPICGTQASLLSASISTRTDLSLSMGPGVYEVPSKKLYYGFWIYLDTGTEELTVSSVGLVSGVKQSQTLVIDNSSSANNTYSGSFAMNEEDQSLTVTDASNRTLYYGVRAYKDEVTAPSVSGVTFTFNDPYNDYRNIPVKITSIVNPDNLPMEVATVPYDSSDQIMADYDQASSIEAGSTSFENTDIVVPSNVGISYVIIKVRLNKYIGGDVYYQSDKLMFT